MYHDAYGPTSLRDNSSSLELFAQHLSGDLAIMMGLVSNWPFIQLLVGARGGGNSEIEIQGSDSLNRNLTG
jgi:hypothetical protein